MQEEAGIENRWMDGWLIYFACIKKNLSHRCNRNHPGHMASGKNQSIKICNEFAKFAKFEIERKIGNCKKTKQKKQLFIHFFNLVVRCYFILFCFLV